MTNKFEVNRKEFCMIPRNTMGLKEFVASIPDTAAYRIEQRNDGVFLNVYWINVNDIEPDPEPVIGDVYTVVMPHICVYGKLAHEMITDIKAVDGMPFVLDASDTIDLSRGFLDTMLRKIKEYQSPYIIAKGWVKEHMALLDEISTKYHVVIRTFEDDRLR